MLTFQFSQTPLENFNLKEGLVSDETGALAIFEGIVRNHQDGRTVTALEYEALESLAQKEAQKIIEETAVRFPLLAVKCVHRLGRLTIGEMAVWVGVSAPHRNEAFNACRYIIDQVKSRLPIWKKEYYLTGDSSWVNCQHHHDIPLTGTNP